MCTLVPAAIPLKLNTAYRGGNQDIFVVDGNVLILQLETANINGLPKVEPISMNKAAKSTVDILDKHFENLINNDCSRLDYLKWASLPVLSKRNKERFDGTLKDFQADPSKFYLQLGAMPYKGRPFPVHHSQMLVFKKEVKQLLDIG